MIAIILFLFVTSFCKDIYITSLPENKNLTCICFIPNGNGFIMTIPRYLTRCINTDFPERFQDLLEDTLIIFNESRVIDITVEQFQERSSSHYISATSPFLIPLRCNSPYETVVLDGLIENGMSRLRTLHVGKIRIPK